MSTAGLDPRVRLRVAVESAGGPRVFVLADDLRTVLDGDGAPNSIPAPVPAPRSPETAGPAWSGETPRVELPVDREHAYRLAKAAWETSPERLAEQGPWDGLPYSVREGQADAAERALELLAGIGGPSEPAAREEAPEVCGYCRCQVAGEHMATCPLVPGPEEDVPPF